MERAACGDGRVELADAPGGGVAGIGEDRLARFLPALVHLDELVAAHIDLAAHLENLRRVGALQRLGDIVHGLEIDGDVLAHRAIAPGPAPEYLAVSVALAPREPARFVLRHPPNRLLFRPPHQAADPRAE